MSTLYVGVDSIITTMLTDDNSIIAYTEFTRDDTLLDKLYSLIMVCKPSKINFIIRGIYSDVADSDNIIGCSLSINNTVHYCNVSKPDVEIIRHLVQKTNVKSYRIIDRLGYLAAIKKNNVCYVSPYGDMTEIVVVANGVKDITYTRPLNVESVLLQNKRNFGICDFVDTATYADATLLSKWKNVNEITDKKALVAMTCLSYADTEASDFFELEHKVLKGDTAYTHGEWQGLKSMFSGMRSKKSNKSEKATREKGVITVDKLGIQNTSNTNNIILKEVKHGTLQSLVSVACILLFIVIVSSLTINKFVSQDASAIERQKANIAVEVENYNSQESYLSSYLENYSTDAIYSSYLSKILAIKTKCCIGEVEFHDGAISVMVYTSKDSYMKKYQKALAKQFSIESVQALGNVTVNDTVMTKYKFVITS